MSAVDFLERLDRVRRTRPGRWIACCPAHNDRSPSLAIRELDDGSILVHCFAGCRVEEIVGAVGLTFNDLFPERAIDHRAKGERRPFAAHDILACIAFEALIAATAAANMAAGWPINNADRERLTVAAERLSAARRISGGE